MSKKIKSNIMLLAAAIIWGIAFVAQKAGATLEPFTYNGVRMVIGGIVLIPVVVYFSKKGNTEYNNTNADTNNKKNKYTIIGGVVCGLILCLASNLQQFGIYFNTDAGKAGFITSLYIIFVPVIGTFLGKKTTRKVWICVLLGAFGFYLLTMAGKSNGTSLQTGDLYVLMCSVIFAMHIIAIDFFSPKSDGIKLSCIQFLVAGVVSLILMLVFENPQITNIIKCWAPILYCGVLSTGVAYTLQVMGQKQADPTQATLIMSLEAVFAVIAGVVIAGERINYIEGIGCLIIFIAVILPQLDFKNNKASVDTTNKI